MLTILVSLLGGVGVLPTGPAAATSSETAGATLSSGSVLPDGRRGPRHPQPTQPALPADSGEGTRVVFAIGQQRVWLVAAGERGDVVRRTHLTSGSV